MADYWRADEEVSDLAQQIIKEHHPHLAEARILYLFRDKASSKNGKTVLGTASKVSAKECAIAGTVFDFKIELAWDCWSLSPSRFRRALMDHELCHCWGEPGAWEMRPHDLEEFAEVVERHGLWKIDVAHFVERVQQLDLFGGDGADGPVADAFDAMRPKEGSGIDAVEITDGSGRGVRLTRDGSKSIGPDA